MRQLLIETKNHIWVDNSSNLLFENPKSQKITVIGRLTDLTEYSEIFDIL